MNSAYSKPGSRLLRRAISIVTTLVTCDFRRVGYSLWLKYHRLDYGAVRWTAELGGDHVFSGGPDLDKVIRSLNVPAGNSALDIGAGKGIAALTLAKHFASVMGVELSPELVAIARTNVAKVRAENVDVRCADARHLGPEIDQINYIYMFNPFPTSVMIPVVERLKQSLTRHPRPLTIIYYGAVCHDVLVGAGFKHTKDCRYLRSFTYSIYEA